MKNTTAIAVSFALMIPLMGCMYGYAFKPAHSQAFIITGVDYDVAFNRSLRALTDLGYSVVMPNRDAGTFTATMVIAGGFGNMTSIDGYIEQSDGDGLYLNLKVQSSRPTQDVFDEFVGAYRQYASIEKR